MSRLDKVDLFLQHDLLEVDSLWRRGAPKHRPPSSLLGCDGICAERSRDADEGTSCSWSSERGSQVVIDYRRSPPQSACSRRVIDVIGASVSPGSDSGKLLLERCDGFPGDFPSGFPPLMSSTATASFRFATSGWHPSLRDAMATRVRSNSCTRYHRYG